MQEWLFTTYVCTGSLFAIVGLNQFVLFPAPTTIENTIWFGIQVLPLLLPLPATMSGSIKGTFTLCMVSLLYFIHGVLLSFDEGGLAMGLIEITFALGLCAATAFLVRRLREIEAAS